MNKIFEKLPIQRQKQIILAAFEEFSQHGYENASTNRLVKSLAISKGILFKYFSSKLQLYTYLVQIAVDRLLTHMERYHEPQDDWQAILLHHASVEFDFLIHEPAVYRFFYRIQQDLDHPKLQEVREHLTADASRYLMQLYERMHFSIQDDFLLEHITLIFKGYNETFVQSLHQQQATEQDKARYLNGLKKHLNLIRR